MLVIDNNVERAKFQMKDLTVAVISNNIGIVAITPLKHCDTVFHGKLAFRLIFENTRSDYRTKWNAINYPKKPHWCFEFM